MINIQVTEEEFNDIIHGLYILEDQSWFIGKDKTEKLIKKLNSIEKVHNLKKEAMCDI